MPVLAYRLAEAALLIPVLAYKLTEAALLMPVLAYRLAEAALLVAVVILVFCVAFIPVDMVLLELKYVKALLAYRLAEAAFAIPVLAYKLAEAALLIAVGDVFVNPEPSPTNAVAVSVPVTAELAPTMMPFLTIKSFDTVAISFPYPRSACCYSIYNQGNAGEIVVGVICDWICDAIEDSNAVTCSSPKAVCTAVIISDSVKLL